MPETVTVALFRMASVSEAGLVADIQAPCGESFSADA